MSLVSSGLARFIPFAHHDRRRHHAEQDMTEASETEIAAVEFADAFAQFNLDVCHRRNFLQNHNQQQKVMMAPLPFAPRHTTSAVSATRIDENATIAFAEEATASTSSYDEEKNCSSAPANISGGLKRTVSSLHFYGASLAATAAASANTAASVSSATSSRSSSIASSPGVEQMPFCWHANQQQSNAACLVQANQIEMEFLSMSGTPFELIVHAPSGERSSRIAFCCGRTAMFAPRRAGCGHGNWRFEIRVADPANSKKVIKKTEEVLYFDGVGTLFFCVDADLRLTLTSQQFLRLPSHNRCCSSAPLKHSITQPTFS